jgi:hypothetical protein
MKASESILMATAAIYINAGCGEKEFKGLVENLLSPKATHL